MPDVETYPLPIHRLISLPDGRLFGTAQAYSGRFLFDPITGKGIPLGNGGPSIYALAVHGDKLYWSGYPSGPIDEFDPGSSLDAAQGWPARPRAARHQVSPKATRAAWSTRCFRQTRVKKVFSAVVGADGRIYFGGAGIRDYAGGSFAWFDPESGEYDGMWRPFSGYRIYWLTTALDGRYIVASTKTATDELNNDVRPDSAKLFVWDTVKQKIVRDFAPVPTAPKAGPVVEVEPGLLLGTTEDPETENGGLLYGVDVRTSGVLFSKKFPTRFGSTGDTAPRTGTSSKAPTATSTHTSATCWSASTRPTRASRSWAGRAVSAACASSAPTCTLQATNRCAGCPDWHESSVAPVTSREKILQPRYLPRANRFWNEEKHPPHVFLCAKR